MAPDHHRKLTDEARLHRGVVLLLSMATGLSVANLYYSQPLLDTIGHQLHLIAETTGLVVTGWLPLAFGLHSLTALLIGIVLLDLAVQGLRITNQSEIYRLKPEARSQLNSAYLTLYFVGGALGSALSTMAYTDYDWIGVCALGTIIGVAAAAVWPVTLILAKKPVTRQPGDNSLTGIFTGTQVHGHIER